MKYIQTILIGLLLAIAVSCDGGKSASSHHKSIIAVQASSKPTLNPQKDAKMHLKEQLDIIGSSKSFIDKIEAAAESSNKFAKAYTDANQEQGFKEMYKLEQELLIDEMLENDKSVECVIKFLKQAKEEIERIEEASEKEQKEFEEKLEGILKKCPETLGIMNGNVLNDEYVDEQKKEILTKKFEKYSDKYGLTPKKTTTEKKIEFINEFINKLDHNDFDYVELEKYVRKHLSSQAFKQLDAFSDYPKEEPFYDTDYFLDGYVSPTGHEAQVKSRNVTHVQGNWFKVSSTLYDPTAPYTPTSKASYQVMVEEVDGKYMITKLKIN